MRCPNCNEKVLDDVNFCHNCGYNLKQYRENLNLQREITNDEDKNKNKDKDTKDTDYEFSNDVMNIFNIQSKSNQDEQADRIIEENKAKNRPKKIEDIFQVINKNNNQQKDFSNVSQEEKNTNYQDFNDDEEDNDTIFITKGYDDNQQKIRRDESIKFTSEKEFTVHKFDMEDEDEDDMDKLFDNLKINSKKVFDKVNLFFTKVLTKMVKGNATYAISARIFAVIFSAVPLVLFFINTTNNWTLLQKIRAIVVVVAVLLIDILQKLLSYNLGLKLSNIKMYQPLDKLLKKNIVVLLTLIESAILTVFAVITAGGLAGFGSSVFTFTFLGAHSFVYLLVLLIMIFFATVMLNDRYDYDNFMKVYGLNAAGILVTRLVIFMVVMTLLQKIFFGLAPGLM